MRGKSALFWLGLAAAAGGVLFQTSYEVQELEEKLASVNRKIMAEQEAIQILKAEWSYLNDPTRLENLSRQHLALQPTDARQFVALDIVPLRPEPAPEAAPALAGVKGGPTPLPPMAGLAPAQPGNAKPAAATSGVIPAAATPPKPAPIKPSAIIPAAAKAPAPPAAKPAPVLTTKPTDIAEHSTAKVPTPPKPQPAAAAPPQPKPTDSIGVLVARLGANR